ncbi:heterodisulfide reductase-related iron-sulfur binding cluster [Desulfosarcina sp.]|uniref:heterodisulfide reductase-related iron-sulfur binding cluster n=1 Tax=Desulfosarcina sp. TaxID=2027861 RepID=UPI003970DCB5
MKTYAFFPGCAYQSAAGYAESVAALNPRLGIRLKELDDWNCCGATAAFSLNEGDGLALCGRLFALAQKEGHTDIVTVCNACYTTLRKAGKRLTTDPPALAEVSRRLADQGLGLALPLPKVLHYLDLLVAEPFDRLLIEQRQAEHGAGAVAVYYGCQYSRPWATGPEAQHPVVLQRLLTGLGFDVVEHSAGTLCCGASHAVPYADACSPMIGRIVGEIRNKGGRIITTICPMCQFNLDAGQRSLGKDPLPVTYFTQMIGRALGIGPVDLGLNKLLISLSTMQKKAS